MDILATATGYVIPFLIVLTVVVFVHEWGHFIVARLNGVRVDVFSVGFGPELFGWYDSKGTRWRVSAIPLGGYVKFHGDAGAASTPAGDLDRMSAAEREVSFTTSGWASAPRSWRQVRSRISSWPWCSSPGCSRPSDAR